MKPPGGANFPIAGFFARRISSTLPSGRRMNTAVATAGLKK
jgi:hypothetical protein